MGNCLHVISRLAVELNQRFPQLNFWESLKKTFTEEIKLSVSCWIVCKALFAVNFHSNSIYFRGYIQNQAAKYTNKGNYRTVFHQLPGTCAPNFRAKSSLS